MKFCLLFFGFIFASIGLAAVACAQPCPNCQQPSIQAAGQNGWYKSDKFEKSVDLYHNGQYLGSLQPHSQRWISGIALSGAAENSAFKFKEKFGHITASSTTEAMPKECICKEGQCECNKCPNDCVARKSGLQALIAGPRAPNFGMNWLGTNEEHYSINGREVMPDNAIQQINDGTPTLADDSQLTKVTVLSANKSAREAVLNDFATSTDLAAYKGKVVAQGFDPGDWQIAKMGYQTTGNPTVYVQDASGKVLHRQDDYTDGAKGLALALGKIDSLRQPAPQYDAAADPDLRNTNANGKPATAGQLNTPVAAGCLGLVIGGLTLAGFIRRKL